VIASLSARRRSLSIPTRTPRRRPFNSASDAFEFHPDVPFAKCVDVQFDARVAADERAAIAREDAAAADAKRRATREQKFGLDAQQRVDRERRDQLWAEEKRKGLEATRGGRESSEKAEVGRGSVAVIGGEEMAPRGKKTREPPKRRALAPFAFRR